VVGKDGKLIVVDEEPYCLTTYKPAAESVITHNSYLVRAKGPLALKQFEIKEVSVKAEPRRCGKIGCNKLAAGDVQGSLRYAACARHFAEIEALVDRIMSADKWVELRRLCDKASPEPWELRIEDETGAYLLGTSRGESAEFFDDADAAYIAALDPDTVRILLTAVQERDVLRLAVESETQRGDEMAEEVSRLKHVVTRHECQGTACVSMHYRCH